MPSLEEDIDAAVRALGSNNIGLIWGLGTYNWPSAKERDAFLNSIKNLGISPDGEE